MKIGIGLPTMLAGVEPQLVYDWARTADAAGFSTVSTGELLTHLAYDAVVALAAVAAVTSRVRLMTNVLVPPLHNAGVLAKQLASIDRLSQGRLTVGIGVGGSKPVLFDLTGDQKAHANFPDYAAAPTSGERRAERCDEQVAYMKRIWSGDAPLTGVPPIGPAPARAGGPELLSGSFSANGIRRTARWADGMTSFDHGADAAKVGRDFELARQAWRDADRDGPPRLVGSFYFSLGPRADEAKAWFLDTHYGYLSPDGRAAIGARIGTVGTAAVGAALRAYDDIGADEVQLVPMFPSLEQVERASELLA